MIRWLSQQALQRIAIRENIQTGERLHVGPGSIISAPQRLLIGNDVYIGKHVTIQVDGVIGDEVLVANLVGLVGRSDHDFTNVGVAVRNGEWVGDAPERLSKRTVIGSDVWLGYGAIVLSGVVVGDSTIVGAGTVIVSDIPPNSVVVGNPGRVVGNRFGEKDLERHWSILKSRGVRILSEGKET